MPTISQLTIDVEARTSKFSSGMKTAITGLAALGAGAIYAFKQFEAAEQISNQTAAAIESTGGAANVTAREVSNLASVMSEKTGIDDEAIQSGENLLLTFRGISNEVGKGNQIFDRATMAITDMSVAMGQDLKSSAIQVGKALNDPIAGLSALSRVGVTFTDQQKRMIERLVETGDTLGAQKIILRELTTEFGGSAQAQATASGKLSLAFGNMAEAVGGALAPAITSVTQSITALANWFTNLAPSTQRLITLIGGGLVAAFFLAKAAAIAFSLSNPFTAIALAATLLTALIIANWDKIKTFTLEVWDKIKGYVLPVFNAIKTVAMAWFTFFKTEFNVLKAIVIAVFDFIRNYVIPVFKGLIDGFRAVVDFVRDHFVEPIVNFIGRIIDAIGQVVGWVKDRLLGAWQAIKEPVLAVINAIIGAVETLIGWIRDAIDWLKQLGQGVADELAGQIGIDPGGGITVGGGQQFTGSNAPSSIAGNDRPIELHLHGDLARLVDSVDQELAGKARRNVRLAHHGRG